MTERELVNKFLNEFRKHAKPSYVYVDRDSKSREFKSGWDFLVSRNRRVIFCEAKLIKTDSDEIAMEKMKKIANELTDVQKLTANILSSVGTDYFIFLFTNKKIYLRRDIFISSGSFSEIVGFLDKLLD